jgi:hypothetical protein
MANALLKTLVHSMAAGAIQDRNRAYRHLDNSTTIRLPTRRRIKAEAIQPRKSTLSTSRRQIGGLATTPDIAAGPIGNLIGNRPAG